MRTFNLTCEAVEATLADYFDDTLEGWVRESIDEHLAECARCTDLARELRTMERDAASLPALPPERDLWPEVAQGIGAPVVAPRPVPQPELLTAPSEAPPVAETSAVGSEVSPPIHEEISPPTYEPEVPTAEPLPTAAPLPPTNEAPLPTTEAPPTRSEPLPTSEEPLVFPIAAATAVPEHRGKRRRPLSMGLAAAALVLVTAGSTFLLTISWLGPARTTQIAAGPVNQTLSSGAKPSTDRGVRAPLARQQMVADSSASIPPPGSPLTVATASVQQVSRAPEDIVYDKEISTLQPMIRRRRGELDASTVAVVERNLRIIDSEIAQIRAALQQDPGNPFLGDQVSRALDMKVELLRRVAMLRSNT